MLKNYLCVLIIAAVKISLSMETAMSWGHIEDRQSLLFDQFFSDRAERGENYLAPMDFSFSTRGITILAIHVTDLTGVEGGTAEILEGGVGNTYVKMKLIPDGIKLLLNVEIFGSHDDRFLFKRRRK